MILSFSTDFILDFGLLYFPEDTFLELSCEETMNFMIDHLYNHNSEFSILSNSGIAHYFLSASNPALRNKISLSTGIHLNVVQKISEYIAAYLTISDILFNIYELQAPSVSVKFSLDTFV